MLRNDTSHILWLNAISITKVSGGEHGVVRSSVCCEDPTRLTLDRNATHNN